MEIFRYIIKYMFLFGLLLFGYLLFFIASISGCTDQAWDRESVEQAMRVEIPSDARNVTYSGYAPHGGHLDLRFEAPPQSAMTFVEHFCNGQVIRGFDPFNATIVDRSDPNGHSIDMGYFRYYALSRDTKNTTYGIRCPFFRLLVDQSRDDIYSVHLLQEFSPHNSEEMPAEYTGTPFGLSPN